MAPWEGKRVPVPVWTLEGGVTMPTLALNTVALSVEDTERAVLLALANGISHIDFHPGKERDGVAKVIAQGVSPDSLFLTTKIRKAPPGTSPAEAADLAQSQIAEDLKALGVDAVGIIDILKRQFSSESAAANNTSLTRLRIYFLYDRHAHAP